MFNKVIIVVSYVCNLKNKYLPIQFFYIHYIIVFKHDTLIIIEKEMSGSIDKYLLPTYPSRVFFVWDWPGIRLWLPKIIQFNKNCITQV